jgi:acyl dehydratase
MAIITKDIQEGHEFSGKLKTVTEERVYAFSGGFPKGPGWPRKTIHTDLEFAKSCGLPTRAASGAMFEGYLTELMIDLFGENWLRRGKMSLTFIAIVDPGDTLVPKSVVRSKQAEGSRVRFVMEVWCENQHGNKVVVGTATGLVQ